MNSSPPTAARVTAAADLAGVGVRALAEESGVAYSTLWRKMRGRSSFTVEEIERIAAALSVDPVTLVEFRAVA